MPNVLLVDDDEDFLSTIRDFLEFSNYSVDVCMDGNEALEALTYGSFDAVVMDWTLPGMGGIDVCKQYRQNGGKMPVLLLTGNDGATYRNQSLEAGATEFLTKPVDLRRLLERIEAAIAAYRQPQT
jgi:DNA-binding response OmpR family regulator